MRLSMYMYEIDKFKWFSHSELTGGEIVCLEKALKDCSTLE